MIKLLLLLLTSHAWAGDPGNSCTPKTVFDASGNCTIYTEPIPVSNLDLSTITTALAGKQASGSYLTVGAVSTSYVDLSTVTAALSSKLGAAQAIAPAYVDLSTVTTALASKLGTAQAIAPAFVDLSTVTTALAGKLGTAQAIGTAFVNLSTVTTAIALKANLAGATFTGASGLTNVALTLTGAGGNVISASSVTTTASLFGASISISSTAYLGVSLSTQAAGTAGTLVTKSCPAGTFALSGGCSCTSGVAATDSINMPFPTLTAAGAMPTGWQCQLIGTTGGQCAAFVICSKVRF